MASPSLSRTNTISVWVVVGAVLLAAAATATVLVLQRNHKAAQSTHHHHGSSGPSGPSGSSGSFAPPQIPLPAPTNVQVLGQPGGLMVTAATPPVLYPNQTAVATAVTTAEAGEPCGAAPPTNITPAAQVYMSATTSGLAAFIPTTQPACVWVQLQGGSSVLGPFAGTALSVAPGSGPAPPPPPLPIGVTLTAAGPTGPANPTVLSISTQPPQGPADTDWQVIWYRNGEQMVGGPLAGNLQQEVPSSPPVSMAYYVVVYSAARGYKAGSTVSNTVTLGPPAPTLPSALALVAQTGQPGPFPTRITAGTNTPYLNAVWFIDGVQVFSSALSMTPSIPAQADGKSHLYGLVLTVPGTTIPTSSAQLQYP
jgi:hypothetical protein